MRYLCLLGHRSGLRRMGIARLAAGHVRGDRSLLRLAQSAREFHGGAGHALDREAHRSSGCDRPSDRLGVEVFFMSGWAESRMVLTRTSHVEVEGGLLLVLDDPTRMMPCDATSVESSSLRSFAWQDTETDAVPLGVAHGSTVFCRCRPAWSRQLPAGPLPLGDEARPCVEGPSEKCFHAAPSLLNLSQLALGHSLGADPAPVGTARFCFFGFQKNLCTKNAKKDFPEPSENAPLGTRERGTLAALSAGCSEGNPERIETGEIKWHSTKTKLR